MGFILPIALFALIAYAIAKGLSAYFSMDLDDDELHDEIVTAEHDPYCPSLHFTQDHNDKENMMTTKNPQEPHSRSEYAKGFRDAAFGVRKHNNASIATLLNQAALVLATLAVNAGYITRDQIEQATAQGKAEAQANLDAVDAGHDNVENAFEPLARHFERIADLVEGKSEQATPSTDQPITRAKVAARLREIAAVLLPLMDNEDTPTEMQPIQEATALEQGAAAAGWVNQEEVHAKFAENTHNTAYLSSLEWLATQIESENKNDTTAQGDGATAPFSDISTEASKRAALANELRTVRNKLRAFSSYSDPRGQTVIDDEQLPLVDKAIELAFITDEEYHRIFIEAYGMAPSVDSYLSALSVVADRIEHGTAAQAKVA